MSSILEDIMEPQPEPEVGSWDVFIEQIHHNLDSKEILRRLLRLTLPQDVI